MRSFLFSLAIFFQLGTASAATRIRLHFLSYETVCRESCADPNVAETPLEFLVTAGQPGIYSEKKQVAGITLENTLVLEEVEEGRLQARISVRVTGPGRDSNSSTAVFPLRDVSHFPTMQVAGPAWRSEGLVYHPHAGIAPVLSFK